MTELTSVSEPSTCAYEMRLDTPAACTPAHRDRAERVLLQLRAAELDSQARVDVVRGPPTMRLARPTSVRTWPVWHSPPHSPLSARCPKLEAAARAEWEVEKESRRVAAEARKRQEEEESKRQQQQQEQEQEEKRQQQQQQQEEEDTKYAESVGKQTADAVEGFDRETEAGVSSEEHTKHNAGAEVEASEVPTSAAEEGPRAE